MSDLNRTNSQNSIHSIDSETPLKHKDHHHIDIQSTNSEPKSPTMDKTENDENSLSDDKYKTETNIKDIELHVDKLPEYEAQDNKQNPSKKERKIRDRSNSYSQGSQSNASITQQTMKSDGPTSPHPLGSKRGTDLLDHTKLIHQGDDVEIGDGDTSPVIVPFGKGHKPKMPSVSFNAVDKELRALRRASRRKWWSPTRLCDWCMHKLFFGKLLIMILTWTTVIDYGKDLYVAYHLGLGEHWIELVLTLSILFLSLRLMLYLKASDDSRAISFTKLLIFYLPGSVYADFQIDRFSDVGVCVFWEIAILFGTPLVPFFLIYLSSRKSYSLFFSDDNFENPHLLSYAVVEALFETIPQLILQSYLYLSGSHDEISINVFIIAWIVCVIVLIKIPIVVWYNWRIVYKLSFKRRHVAEIMSIKFHPVQDIVATGSWDHTVLINSIIGQKNSGHSNLIPIKAKRVLDHHYNINCIAWMPKFIHSINNSDTDLIAVAGQGIEIFNWRLGKSVGQFPRTKERDPLRRKKRHRTKEVREVIFSPDGQKLIWCQGKNVLVWDIQNKKELLKIKCIQGNRLGDVQCIDMSPNGKYIACGLYQNNDNIKVYNSSNKDLIRILSGHTSSVHSVKFDRFGKYVISGSADNTVRVFDLRSGQQIKQFNKHQGEVMSIAIDYTNKYIASGGRDKVLYITYLDDDTNHDNNHNNDHRKLKITVNPETGSPSSISDNTIIKELKALKGWKPYKTIRDIRCIDFSPYGDTVGCASEDHKVHLLSLPDECHHLSKHQQHKYSMDQQQINKLMNQNNPLKEINDENENENDDSTSTKTKHQKKYSDMGAITTNKYSNFNPKEHEIY